MARAVPAPRIVVAAAESGAGKTTVTLGLLRALKERGFRAQPFKVGPDFIDPSHHASVAGTPSRTLDSWMCTDATVREIFAHAARAADISVIEGVMGLFDGYGPEDDRGSTAHVARLLDCPVVVVVDAQRSAASAAAVAFGLERFDPTLRVAGVIFNRVGGAAHYEWLKRSLRRGTGLTSLGYLVGDPGIAIPERHLGLVPAAERAPDNAFLDGLSRQFRAQVELDAIVEIATAAPPVSAAATLFRRRSTSPRARIGVARDEALNFYYEDNLELLECEGARLEPFDLVRDRVLPEGIDGLYLGGGFPEMLAARIAANRSMRQSIRDFHASGGLIYAECGGLMVLCEALVDFDGRRHEMVGLVPATARMQRQRLSLGYCEVEALRDTVIAASGTRYRAQTFHYSELTDVRFEPAMRISHGTRCAYDGFASEGLLATYVHAHFAGCPRLAARFVEECASTRRSS